MTAADMSCAQPLAEIGDRLQKQGKYTISWKSLGFLLIGGQILAKPFFPHKRTFGSGVRQTKQKSLMNFCPEARGPYY
jgi:hypothetical protein